MSFNLTSEFNFSTNHSKLVRETSDRKAGFGKLPLVILIVFSGLIAVDRLVVPQVPFNVDPATYAVVSHELLQGKSLYTDIWDHKPPAIFVTYELAELAFGYSPQTLVILNILISLVALFGIYWAGKTGPGGVVSGLLAAALWLILSGTFQLEGRDPNTEPFLNACMIWAFALLARYQTDGLKPQTSIIIGLLFVIGTFFKPIIAAAAVGLVCAHVLFSPNKKQAVKSTLLIGTVGAVGWLALFGYFAATDRFEVFYKAIVSYNRFYSGNMLANIVAPLRDGTELIPDFMNPLAIVAVVGVVLAFISNRRQGALLAAFIGSSWIAIALPGRFSVHYFQLWLPSLIVGACWAIGFFAATEGFRFKMVSYVVGGLLFGTLIFSQVSTYKTVFANEWFPAIRVLNAGEGTADRINGLLVPDETFFLWGSTPSLYLLSGRRPPAPVLFNSHFDESPVSEQLTKRAMSDLARNRPELLIVEKGRSPVPTWIAQDYESTPIYHDKDSYTFYARRGGRLAQQVNSPSIEK